MDASDLMTKDVKSCAATDSDSSRVQAGSRGTQVETFVLVVMEHGSAWPLQVGAGAAGCVALGQEPHETHGELLRRAYGRIRAIERRGGAIEVAVLSCNDDPSTGALAGRVPLARALLATVLHTGQGRLDLVARSSAPNRTKQSLVALAGTLTEVLVGTSASVSARFTGPPSVESTHVRPRRTVHERRAAHFH